MSECIDNNVLTSSHFQFHGHSNPSPNFPIADKGIRDEPGSGKRLTIMSSALIIVFNLFRLSMYLEKKRELLTDMLCDWVMFELCRFGR